jgi:hypothetical protein
LRFVLDPVQNPKGNINGPQGLGHAIILIKSKKVLPDHLNQPGNLFHACITFGEAAMKVPISPVARYSTRPSTISWNS